MTQEQIDSLHSAFIAGRRFEDAFADCGAADCLRLDAKERWREWLDQESDEVAKH